MLREPRVARLTDVTRDEVERLEKVNTLFKMFDVPGHAHYAADPHKATRGIKPFAILNVGQFGRRRYKRFRCIEHLEADAAKLMQQAQSSETR